MNELELELDELEINLDKLELDYKVDLEIDYKLPTNEQMIFEKMKMTPNKIWTLVSFDNGDLAYINRYDPKGLSCFFGEVEYNKEDKLISYQ